ncbi:hypothetical protein HaLaN_08780 [Haematococcus lacustris]|uniref:Uncharacterized protein n=1 Tax=Haematococcus lacustris TaxID=44745 RepID=A0A699Z134_HAELA|nr:hypothetical protein HaLaN_08780 [Haematococcus lacustris]
MYPLASMYMLMGLGSQLLRGPLAQALGSTEALTAAVEGEAARGEMQEVVVTRKGVSTEVRQALARLLSLTQQTGPNARHFTPLTVDGVLAAALSDELRGLGTDVTADEAELAAIDMPAAVAALEPDAGF